MEIPINDSVILKQFLTSFEKNLNPKNKQIAKKEV
jgi:hypothetical protein